MSVVAKVSASPLAVSTVVELLKNPPKEAGPVFHQSNQKLEKFITSSLQGEMHVYKKGMYYLDTIDSA